MKRVNCKKHEAVILNWTGVILSTIGLMFTFYVILVRCDDRICCHLIKSVNGMFYLSVVISIAVCILGMIILRKGSNKLTGCYIVRINKII